MKNLKYIILFAIIGYQINGQDATFTQYMFNHLNLNPALVVTGNSQGSFQMNSRQQWLNLPGPTSYSGAYTFNQASVRLPIPSRVLKGFYTGFQFEQTGAGEGELNSFKTQSFIGLSRRMAKNTTAQFGMGIGIIQNYLNWNYLTFTSQLDHYLGFVNPSPNVNPQLGQSNIAVTPSFGLRVQQASLDRSGRLKYVTNLGAAVYHFNKPTISFFDNNSAIQPRYSFYMTSTNLMNKKYANLGVGARYIVLSHVYEYQSPLITNSTNLGVQLGQDFFVFSGFRRKKFLAQELNVDAVFFAFNWNMGWALGGLSYDWTISALNNSRTSGTAEMSFSLPFNYSKKWSRRLQSDLKENCWVDYLLMDAEWRANENFRKNGKPRPVIIQQIP